MAAKKTTKRAGRRVGRPKGSTNKKTTAVAPLNKSMKQGYAAAPKRKYERRAKSEPIKLDPQDVAEVLARAKGLAVPKAGGKSVPFEDDVSVSVLGDFEHIAVKIQSAVAQLNTVL